MNRFRPLPAVAAVAVWTINCMLAVDLIPELAPAIHGNHVAFRPAHSLESPMVSEALAITTNFKPIRYAGNFDDPFRPPSAPVGIAARGSAVQPASVRVSRDGLRLRGVLVKQKPMAIIEDETGKAWICGQGDTVSGAVITKITGERVTLRGSRGSFDLIVKE